MRSGSPGHPLMFGSLVGEVGADASVMGDASRQGTLAPLCRNPARLVPSRLKQLGPASNPEPRANRRRPARYARPTRVAWGDDQRKQSDVSRAQLDGISWPPIRPAFQRLGSIAVPYQCPDPLVGRDSAGCALAQVASLAAPYVHLAPASPQS